MIHTNTDLTIDISDVEAFVIYTGKKRIEKDVISLNQEFFGGNPAKPEFIAKIIHGDYIGGILEEYIGFCRIWDEHVLGAKTPEQKQEAVAKSIDLCIEKGYLAEYCRN